MKRSLLVSSLITSAIWRIIVSDLRTEASPSIWPASDSELMGVFQLMGHIVDEVVFHLVHLF